MATAREHQRAAEDSAATSNGYAASGLQPPAWPVDQEGDPLVEVSFQANELIGLKEFSNIVVGPATVRTLVSMNKPNPFTDKQLANIASALNQLAETVEVEVIARERKIALDTIDPAKRHDS